MCQKYFWHKLQHCRLSNSNLGFANTLPTGCGITIWRTRPFADRLHLAQNGGYAQSKWRQFLLSHLFQIGYWLLVYEYFHSADDGDDLGAGVRDFVATFVVEVHVLASALDVVFLAVVFNLARWVTVALKRRQHWKRKRAEHWGYPLNYCSVSNIRPIPDQD